MANQWIRLWLDLPNDPKWRTISRLSSQPISLVISIYVHLLVNAANAIERGVTQCDADDVASALDTDKEAVEAVIKAMQCRVLDGWKLLGWDKRQPVREDNSTDRTRAWRDKQKPVTHSDADVTQHDAPEEKRLDTDKKEKEGYAFAGKVIKLTNSDFLSWQASYHLLNIRAELQSRDDWLASNPAEQQNWFIRMSNHLAKKNAEVAAKLVRPKKSNNLQA